MKKNDVNAIIGRIRLLREQHTGSRGKSKFARDLNISPSTYSYYENNRIPPIEILLKICEVTGTDLEWLLTGRSTEKKFASGPNSGLLQRLDKLFTDNPDLTEAVFAFGELLCEQMDTRAWANRGGDGAFLEANISARAGTSCYRA